VGSFPLKLFFISSFSYRKARQLPLKSCPHYLNKISQASYFENCLFRIKQLTTLFAAHKVLYWFWVIHFYITMQVIRAIAIQSNAVVQLVVSIDFISVCTFGVWINSSYCCTIGTRARPNLTPTRFITAVWTFALWHSKGKYISHSIAETAIAEPSHSDLSTELAECEGI